jgi:hypothetical protein
LSFCVGGVLAVRANAQTTVYPWGIVVDFRRPIPTPVTEFAFGVGTRPRCSRRRSSSATLGTLTTPQIPRRRLPKARLLRRLRRKREQPLVDPQFKRDVKNVAGHTKVSLSGMKLVPTDGDL